MKTTLRSHLNQVRMAVIKYDSKYWRRSAGKRNSCSLFIGVQINAGIVEISVEGHQRIKKQIHHLSQLF